MSSLTTFLPLGSVMTASTSFSFERNIQRHHFVAADCHADPVNVHSFRIADALLCRIIFGAACVADTEECVIDAHGAYAEVVVDCEELLYLPYRPSEMVLEHRYAGEHVDAKRTVLRAVRVSCRELLAAAAASVHIGYELGDLHLLRRQNVYYCLILCSHRLSEIGVAAFVTLLCSDCDSLIVFGHLPGGAHVFLGCATFLLRLFFLLLLILLQGWKGYVVFMKQQPVQQLFHLRSQFSILRPENIGPLQRFITLCSEMYCCFLKLRDVRFLFLLPFSSHR